MWLRTLSYFQVSLDVTLCCVAEDFCSLSRCHKTLRSLCCVDEDFCSLSRCHKMLRSLCCVDEDFCSLSRCHKTLRSLCCVDEDFHSVSRCHFLLCCVWMVTVQPFPDVTVCCVADDFLFCFQIHLMGLKITGQVPAVSCLHLHIHHPSCPAALTTHSPHPTYITQKW